ncbi:hypothetical protein KIH27_06450 [Mycobacterium sp. M1]|uniref:Uncharacterized protein n=1 Tax=Mycolicibacter acidiphilus TaxID=2835306 RepID=A0ABS5RG11_9MYCO|nr:hypothetical protein [Mycolicibacter acidiphilus]MBS9533230.1 hypothetical protein [Mycolicibacter acidiphilus]
MLHVARDRRGVRRLTEIAVLRPDGTGTVQALTAWRHGHGTQGHTGHADELQRLLRDRVTP